MHSRLLHQFGRVTSSLATEIDYETTPGALPPVVPGLEPKVLLPGGREQLARTDRLEHGVLVDDGEWVLATSRIRR